MCYSEHLSAAPAEGRYVVAEEKKLTRRVLCENFKQLVGTYDLLSQGKEE